MNHLQLIALTASFKFNWPQIVLDYFNTSAPISSATTQFISFDCFIDNRDP